MPSPSRDDARQRLDAFLTEVRASTSLVAEPSSGPIRYRLYCQGGSRWLPLLTHLTPAIGAGWRPLELHDVNAGSVQLRPHDVNAWPGDSGVTHPAAGAVSVLSDAERRTVWVLDARSATAVRYQDSTAPLPHWEVTAPFRAAARWWAGVNGAALVHASSVSDGTSCVLLGGDGGAGKSTSALACVDRGLEVFGDDLCLVEPRPDGPTIASSIYRMAKITTRSLELLPHIGDRIEGEQFGGQFRVALPIPSRPSAPVRAVCHVRQDRDGPTRIEPLPRIETLRRILPSSLHLVDQQWIRPLAELISSVDTFTLYVNDVDPIPDVLRPLLGRYR